MKKKLFICALAVLLLLTGCGKIPKLKNGQEVVVKTEEGNISVDELYNELKKDYALDALLNMTDTKLLGKIYKDSDEEKKYIKTQTEQLEYYYESMKEQYSLSSFEDFLQQQYGVESTDELNKVLSLNYKRNKATEDYAKSIVTDKEIEKYYKENTIGDMELSHILITAEYKSDADEDTKQKAKDEALKKAKEVIKKLDDGEKFEDLAKEYSDEDATKDKGGELGWVKQGEMDEAFENAAKDLNINAYSKEPVETEYGYHVILKTGEKEKAKLSEVKDSIIEKLGEQKQDEDENIQAKALIALRKKYGVEIMDSELKRRYKSYVSNIENA